MQQDKLDRIHVHDSWVKLHVSPGVLASCALTDHTLNHTSFSIVILTT